MTLSIDDVSERQLAKTIDHSLLRPDPTTHSWRMAAVWRRVRRRIGLRSPGRRRAGGRLARGTDVAVGTVIGFPHGSSKTSIKSPRPAKRWRTARPSSTW